MQTFLPYPSYADSARALDNKRLGKQRVECKQILRALGVRVGGRSRSQGSAWRNHPAVQMWRGCEFSLCMYAMAMCREWQTRGYKDSLWWEFFNAAVRLCLTSNRQPPDWLGDPDFHESHRSNLMRKDPSHYDGFRWSTRSDLPYVWPTKQVQP